VRRTWASRPVLVLAGLIVAVAGVRGLHRFWTSALSHLTGPAQWIWSTDVLEELHPEAALFVASLSLDAPPPGALLKISGDREYVAYINGTLAACGWSRPGFRLDLFDVAHLLKQGRNVVAVEVRSPTPVGGLLLALDVDGVGQNVLVSGPAFRMRRRFDLSEPGPADSRVPVTWGRPPRFPWGYPAPQPHPGTLDEMVVEDPVRIDGAKAQAVPGGGTAFHLPAAVLGYLVLELGGEGAGTVASDPDPAWANAGLARETAQPVVRLAGQDRWIDPEPRRIGTIMFFSPVALKAVEVWPVSEELSSVAPGAVAGRLAPVPRTRWTTRNPPE
jgi:hypothetical protein